MRVISKLGFCSRKQAIGLVLNRRVEIGSRQVTDPGERCTFDAPIRVDGKPIAAALKRYLILNKPPGYVTTRSDELGRKTIYDLLGGSGSWITAAGRLDRETSGLLILTNDTRFAAYLTDPQSGVPRVYEAAVSPALSDELIAEMRAGVEIGKGERCAPTRVRLMGATDDDSGSLVEVTLTEGKNREVRRLFAAVGRNVLSLERIQFGPFLLNDLGPGQWRALHESEIAPILSRFDARGGVHR